MAPLCTSHSLGSGARRAARMPARWLIEATDALCRAREVDEQVRPPCLCNASWVSLTLQKAT